MFLVRFMQIDPHWLNIFFGKHPETVEPRFTLLDFGGFRSYSSLFVDRCMHVIRAAYDKDEEKMLKCSRNIGFLTGYESRIIEKTRCGPQRVFWSTASCGYFTATSILGETLASDVPCGFSQKIVTKRIHKLIPEVNGIVPVGHEVVDEVYDEYAAAKMGIDHVGQVATDSLVSMEKAIARDNIRVNDRQVACARINSQEGQDYLKGMAAAANFAWVNRSCMTFCPQRGEDGIALGGWKTEAAVRSPEGRHARLPSPSSSDPCGLPIDRSACSNWRNNGYL
ncbi:hypothetical protein QR680_002795 [Steinernema hermaphroditum]|uniref:3'-phosphate/5'-hydroxy nucleic acid ligase n=1 Tax=Steinernema hermaphroditum TaxID=289476 RepID=A0AA39H5W9_9BILA|nr:hypothetical protein QR680_002795 [Steinernema hermaphroditum]